MAMFPGQRELRHGMINKISEKIQTAVLSVGRTKEDLKKYTLNIESTAWNNSKGNQVCRLGPWVYHMTKLNAPVVLLPIPAVPCSL